jgi:hypothetical protein
MQLFKPLVGSDEFEILDTLAVQRDHRTKFTVAPVAPTSSFFRHPKVDPKALGDAGIGHS